MAEQKFVLDVPEEDEFWATEEENDQSNQSQNHKFDLPIESLTTDQCGDVCLEAIRMFSSNDPHELSYAISLLDHVVETLDKKLFSIVEKQKEQQREVYRTNNRCQYCGGEFKGFFSKSCKTCGRKKDY